MFDPGQQMRESLQGGSPFDPGQQMRGFLQEVSSARIRISRRQKCLLQGSRGRITTGRVTLCLKIHTFSFEIDIHAHHVGRSVYSRAGHSLIKHPHILLGNGGVASTGNCEIIPWQQWEVCYRAGHPLVWRLHVDRYL